MSIEQVWGTLLICFVCPILGGLPLIDWIAYLCLKRKLSQIGNKNVSVSAAFAYGGRLVGLLAVISEASKGILVVLMARHFFPNDPIWELLALISLVIGRYWFTQGAGVTNLVWGIIVHDWRVALMTFLVGGTSFTIFRERQTGRYVVLFIFGLMLVLFHAGNNGYVLAAIALVSLLWWIYQKIPDDLDLPTTEIHNDSKKVFKFFQGKNALLSLDDPLDAHKVGQKAANLGLLKRRGYQVPEGWVVLAGDDAASIVQSFSPSRESPLVVRSSAVGEDSLTASAAGQYLSLLNITSSAELLEAILACADSYNVPSAIEYRQSRGQSEKSMAVIIQKQIKGVYSGVAFSRDPVNPLNPAVIIEALPGSAVNVVSGRKTPQQYQVILTEPPTIKRLGNWGIEELGESLLVEVAKLSRELESLEHGIPQDLEWSYDGERLWLLQARSITTLQPIWTRRIAAEVIPGVMHPLTWSINRPLTCGVWGEIFRIVLGEEATSDLDFNQTATLHYQQAYFNATLLGVIFQRMGLPPDSLDFLTRGAKFSTPPLSSTLKTLPGLGRLFKRELTLDQDFKKDLQKTFTIQLNYLKAIDLNSLSPRELLGEIEWILLSLRKATYYSILAPLSLAWRSALLKVNPQDLDNSQTPEVQSMRSLATIAMSEDIDYHFNLWLDSYGYLSQTATDIAVPRWQEEPETLKAILNSFKQQPPVTPINKKTIAWVQNRLNLKGQVSRIYSQLLAYLRYSFLALEKVWLEEGLLVQAGDIFFLEYEEIVSLVQLKGLFDHALISQRKEQFNVNQALSTIPYIVYGQSHSYTVQDLQETEKLFQGIPVSGGEVEGTVKICRTLQDALTLSTDTILVVPYTDSGWVPLLTQAKGLISEVGGALSHGAIIAREYGIPAVMDVHHATRRLHNGQKIHLNGYTGWIRILDD